MSSLKQLRRNRIRNIRTKKITNTNILVVIISLFSRIKLYNGDVNGMKVKGIVHVKTVGINAVRELGTGLANFFGKKGFESNYMIQLKNDL